MKERHNTIQIGFGFGQVVLAALTGAAVGAAVAYLTAPAAGEASRRRLRELALGGRRGAERVPVALARASEAARAAFVDAIAVPACCDDRSASEGDVVGG